MRPSSSLGNWLNNHGTSIKQNIILLLKSKIDMFPKSSFTIEYNIIMRKQTEYWMVVSVDGYHVFVYLLPRIFEGVGQENC